MVVVVVGIGEAGVGVGVAVTDVILAGTGDFLVDFLIGVSIAAVTVAVVVVVGLTGGCGGAECAVFTAEVVVVGGGGDGADADTLPVRRFLLMALSLSMLTLCIVPGDNGAYSCFVSCRCVTLSVVLLQFFHYAFGGSEQVVILTCCDFGLILL